MRVPLKVACWAGRPPAASAVARGGTGAALWVGGGGPRAALSWDGWATGRPRASQMGLNHNRVRTRPLAAEGRLTLSYTPHGTACRPQKHPSVNTCILAGNGFLKSPQAYCILTQGTCGVHAGELTGLLWVVNIGVNIQKYCEMNYSHLIQRACPDS